MRLFAVAWATLDTRRPRCRRLSGSLRHPAPAPSLPSLQRTVRPPMRRPAVATWSVSAYGVWGALSAGLRVVRPRPLHAVTGAAGGGRPDSHRSAERRAGARTRRRRAWFRRFHGDRAHPDRLPRLSHLLVRVATGANLVRSKFLHAALKSFYEIRRKAKTPGVGKGHPGTAHPRAARSPPDAKLLAKAWVATLPCPPVLALKRPAPREQAFGCPGQRGRFCRTQLRQLRLQDVLPGVSDTATVP